MMSRLFLLVEIVSVSCIICSYFCSDVKYNAPSPFRTVLYLSYIGSLALNFGMQFWVSFIAGSIMRKHLPRRVVGHVQSNMFRAYFLTSTILTAISLCIILLVTPCATWKLTEWVKIVALDVAFLTQFLQQVQLSSLRHNMDAMFAIEKDLGVGDHDGTLTKEEKAKCGKNDKWNDLSRKFWFGHGISAMLNLILFFSTGACLFLSALSLSGI